MRKLVALVVVVSLSGCVSIAGKKGYEYPGILKIGVLGGAAVGPEVVAICAAARRATKDGCDKEEWAIGAIFGWALHVGTTIFLFSTAPPVGWWYLAGSSAVGISEFVDRDGFEVGPR